MAWPGRKRWTPRLACGYAASGTVLCAFPVSFFVRPQDRFFVPTCSAPGTPAADAVKAGRRCGMAASSIVSSPRLDGGEHGEAVIAAVRTQKPDAYLKVVASLLPKQLEIKEGTFDGLADEQLAALLAYARNALGLPQGDRAGASAATHCERLASAQCTDRCWVFIVESRMEQLWCGREETAESSISC
jgi:hypothetical protein